MKTKPSFSFLIFALLSFYPQVFLSQTIWKNNAYKIFLDNNNLQLFHDETKIAELTSIEFNFTKPEKITVERSSKDSLILKLSFNETDGFHDDFPKEIFLNISQTNNTFHFTADHKSFNHISIKLKDQNEHYFGLIEKLFPGNSKNPDLRGNVIDVDVYSVGEKDYAENYASAYSAFYISNLGYASFFDTFAKGKYKLGVNGETEIYHQTGKLDWYIFFGPTGEKIHKEYYDVIGRPKYIPMWACGPIFWRDQNNGGKNELLDDIQKFTDMKIPMTACFVDRPYSEGGHEWSMMNFSQKFAEPEKWIKKINNEYGMQFMTWAGPMTFTDANFPGLLTNHKNYMDLTNPEAVAEFEKRLNSNQYSVGVKGHKMDRADENFPLTALWYQPVSESETRNKYVYLYSKVINDFLSKAFGKDQFNFARAAFHRTQPYLSALWGGDSRPNWLGMSSSQANAMRASFQGFPIWGNDTGGYLGEGKIAEQLYIRWLQWSAWNGMFEIKIDGAGGSGEDRPPWKYSKQLQNVFRNVCDFRMEFLPYIYSCANSSYENGVMMKPLAYMFPYDENTYNVWDEFIFGNAFLVAPLFSEKNEREIYLPEGTWFDFYETSKSYAGPLKINQNVPLERIPVFVKGNSIYVTGDIFRGNSKTWKENLAGKEEITIHLFPGKENEETKFAYVDYLDNNISKYMVLQNQNGKILFESPALSSKANVKFRCESKPREVLLNGNQVDFDFSKQEKAASIRCEKDIEVKMQIIF